MIDAVPFDPPCRGLWERSIRPAFLIRFEHCVELNVLFSACLDGTETALGLFSCDGIGSYIFYRLYSSSAPWACISRFRSKRVLYDFVLGL
jgi:hypothetical protein